MNQHYEAFRKKLQEIFMMDHAELDFGIYRIMNHKRNQINDFLDNQLLPQVEQTLKEYVKTDDSLQQELTKAIEGCKNLGIDPDTNPKVQQLRQQIAQSSTGVDDLQNTVFSRLTQFFSRYYEGGDFVSQRRYKTGGNSAYAIPYNGEEVKLYWANSDQYYIKTSEYFKNYTFKLRDGRRICFVLVDASTEQNNNKNTNGMERRFDILRTEEGQPVIEEVDGELHISFTYELMPKATKQKDLNKKAFETLSTVVPAAWQELLMKEQVTDESVLLEKHINAYTAKNSFDYFIHKDLGGFLSRELDFYIKNEVFVIADLDAAKLQSQLAVVKAIEKVGQKIIDFLAQLENFQKRLWLKKKFVVQSDYCITLDRVPEKFYPEICANDEQRKEWVRLFAIDEIKGDGLFTTGYSEPLTIEFLKDEKNQFLVLDTKFFSEQFKHKLIAEIEELDGNTNGLLVKSDNYHGLRLLNNKFRRQVNGIYIDPPYNTGSDMFIYKDNYMHSSWLSMMESRIEESNKLLIDSASVVISINENEMFNLKKLLDLKYDKYLTTLSVKVRHEDRILKGDKDFHEVYESAIMCSNSSDFKPEKKHKDNTSIDEYLHEVKIVGLPFQTVSMNNKDVEVFAPGSYEIIKHKKPSKSYFKRMSVRGTLREGNSSGRFYVGYLEPIADQQPGYLYKVPNMGDDGLGYRFFWTPSIESGRKNGDYFQGVPQNGKDILDIPYPNYVDFEKEFNDCSNEGGLEYRNGKKPIAFIDYIFNLQKIRSLSNAVVLDFFAGSASTGHALINLNRKDDGKRKYILMQVGDNFDFATLPRIKNVVYSQDWKDGKPVSRNGISQCFKYICLEQYEDTLNNLEVNDGFGKTDNESYVLRYMLDTETRDSLINTKDFVHPFDYTIKTTRDNELVDTPVDLVDTFNYLIGLHVDSIHWHKDDNICVVEGTTHIEKEHALVIWRNQDVIKNDDLNDFFRKQDYSTLDREFDVIYVNGDNTLPNIKSDEEHWKVRLIEQELMKRMFEEE
ncbi:MAG: site-specific DNA-methyltransferase [Prevotella sp.]|nr:site-specific DNA-methyltransferase [Prevotella sp.]